MFNALTGYSRKREYDNLVVAPFGLRTRFRALIEREIEHAKAGRAARIIVKNNAITDLEVLKLLYQASHAGVRLDLIVRGRLRVARRRAGPQRKHSCAVDRRTISRALARLPFRQRRAPGAVLGSADLMERNLDRRVEALVPVRDVGVARHIRDVIFDAYLRDTDRAYVLVDRKYERIQPWAPAHRFNAQEFLLKWYANGDGGGRPKLPSEAKDY